MMALHSLEVDSIIKSFGQKHLLTDIYLKCATGEVIGILGRNGTGKSTLLQIIFGSVETENKSIRVDGKPLSKAYSTGDKIAYLPQGNFLPKNITVSGVIRTFIPDETRRSSVKANIRVEPLLKKKINSLSGGEKRYLQVLLILNLPTAFALLDEPFSQVEPLYRAEIKALIDLHKQEKGIIITDHDYVNLMDVSDKTFLLTGGALKPIQDRKQLIEYNYLPPEKSQSEEEAVDERFITDKQTAKDLGLSVNYDEESLLALFEKPASKGGKVYLEKLFGSPTKSKTILQNRQKAIQFFQTNDFLLKVDKKQLDFIAVYLESGIAVTSSSYFSSLSIYLKNTYRTSNNFYIQETGMQHVFDFLKNALQLATKIQDLSPTWYLSDLAYQIQEKINSNSFRDFIDNYGKKPLSLHFSAFDYILRKKAKEELLWLLERFYEFDAYNAVAQTSRKYKLSIPEYEEEQASLIKIEGLFHPKLAKAVGNDFTISAKENICFLTGANMSGKSTFLKAFGLAAYLAHLGFPVPATKMKTSIFDGLFTTINLSDNLNTGLSHFYSEVKRVKEVASEIKNDKNLVVIFDELFRGTNVKDASAASSLIISAIAQQTGSVYIISSHIMEIAQELEKQKNIFFRCFDVKVVNDEAKYTYKLVDGVSKDSLGLHIVIKEQIVELLEGKTPNS
ncbi:MutS-related protein [Algoriphagus yeomjeoni]|uniref:DNA mismatch repair ATPase MutS n=1 Tax=Algoriphagus yeomjeoni TaxID=291403 RepID=A0A327PU07_9BACT|nr:ATP-binding cassette domain-containing protein [Algoriphagus yeomjeoni]RAI94937.1 DNA mismatch repair ATPase MutS [Algoriphagus yeomjeoni]